MDQADKVRSRLEQENRAVGIWQCSVTFTVSSGSDRVKWEDESKLQRYRVADRENEAFGLGPECIERSAISTYISEQQGARFSEVVARPVLSVQDC